MPRVVEQIALVEHDEIGAGDLILEHLFDGIVVIKRIVRRPLRDERLEIGGHLPVGERGAVHHRNHAVHGDATLDRRPMERLHERLRQREARGLDDDVIDLRPQGEDLVERRHELVGDGAAQAAIGELDDVILGARRVAAAFEISPSMPTSPNSLTITASRRPLALAARGGSASSCPSRESR